MRAGPRTGRWFVAKILMPAIDWISPVAVTVALPVPPPASRARPAMIFWSAVIRALPMSVVMTVSAEYPWSDPSMIALAVIRSSRMFAPGRSQPARGSGTPGATGVPGMPPTPIWFWVGIIVPSSVIAMVSICLTR